MTIQSLSDMSLTDPSLLDFISILVAVLGIGVAAYNFYKMREHYGLVHEHHESVREHHRLSVRPSLKRKVEFDATEAEYCGIYLINKGLGPAKVGEIVMRVDGEPVEKSSQAWTTALERARLDTDTWKIRHPHAGTTIGVGEEYWLFSTTKMPEDSEDANEIINKFRRLDMEIPIESLAGEEQEPLTRKCATGPSLIERPRADS